MGYLLCLHAQKSFLCAHIYYDRTILNLKLFSKLDVNVRLLTLCPQIIVGWLVGLEL